MAFQPAPSIALTTIEGSIDNQLTINDLAWFASGTITQLTLSTLATAVATWVTDFLAPLLSDDWSATRVRAVDLGSATGFVASANIGATGGVAGESNPNNVAACVSLRTAQRGRSGRGRNFVPGIPGSVVTLNTLDPTFIADLISAYTELIGAGTFVTGWQLVVLSRQFEGAPRAEGIGIPVTEAIMVTNFVRSMRSREVGHGA